MSRELSHIKKTMKKNRNIATGKTYRNIMDHIKPPTIQNIVALVLILLCPLVSSQCPVSAPCACEELYQNADGSKSWSVNCENRGLSSLPTFSMTGDLVEELYLRKNLITSIPNNALDAVSGLVVADFSENNISFVGENAFQGQKNSLEYLYLGNNLLRTLPTFATDMTVLRDLVLSTNQITSIPANAFQRTQSLSKLYLNSNRISVVDGAAFAGIQDTLEVIYLQNNSLTSTIIPILADLPRLRILYLANNPIRSIPPSGFGQAFQTIQDLNLEATQLTEFSVTLLSQFRLLRTLLLSNNDQMVTFDLPPTGSLTSTLLDLYLHNMGLTRIPAGIAQMRNLRRLELSRNAITTLDTCAFHNNTNLRTVSLLGNPLLCICEAAGLRFLQDILKKNFRGLNQQCPSDSLKDFTLTTFPIAHCDTRDLCNAKVRQTSTSSTAGATQSPSASPVGSGASVTTLEVTSRMCPAMVASFLVLVALESLR